MNLFLLSALSAGKPPRSYTLSGTSGVPIEDTRVITGSGTVSSGWEFLVGGRIGLSSTDGFTQRPLGEWTLPLDPPADFPDNVHYIRGTLNSGSAPSSGPVLGNWQRMDINREWLWTATGPTPIVVQGSLQIDIATDSAGTNIVATGYYGGRTEIEP